MYSYVIYAGKLYKKEQNCLFSHNKFEMKIFLTILPIISKLSFILTYEEYSAERLNAPQFRIYGGGLAKPNQFPHHVGIVNNGDYNCGGSIIAPNVILTAAHCIFNDKSTEIIAGTIDHTKPKVTRKVTKKIRHEHYFKGPENGKIKLENDIGLLVLEKPLEFNEAINLIKFDAKEPEIDSNVTVLGWGLSNESPNKPNRYLKFSENFKVADSEKCPTHMSIPDGSYFCFDRAEGTGSCNVSTLTIINLFTFSINSYFSIIRVIRVVQLFKMEKLLELQVLSHRRMY